jgi:hypothetical protein
MSDEEIAAMDEILGRKLAELGYAGGTSALAA